MPRKHKTPSQLYIERENKAAERAKKKAPPPRKLNAEERAEALHQERLQRIIAKGKERTVSMTELRKRFEELLDDVAANGTAYTITRWGTPVAVLTRA